MTSVKYSPFSHTVYPVWSIGISTSSYKILFCEPNLFTTFVI